jgi:hypothetical protein
MARRRHLADAGTRRRYRGRARRTAVRAVSARGGGSRRTSVEAVLADLAARARAAGTATPLIDLAVLALRIHNRQIGS